MITPFRGLCSALALAAALAQAHVTLVSPEGGERIQGGSSFTIVWDADDHNCVYHLYYSPDSGKTFSVIALDIDKGVRTFKWSVPDSATGRGVVRILQDNLTGSDLDDRSQAFQVSATSAVREPVKRRAADIAFLPGRMEWAFAAQAPVEATVEAYDPAGRRVAILWRGKVAAGGHRISVPLAPLPSAPGLIVEARLGAVVLFRGRIPARP